MFSHAPVLRKDLSLSSSNVIARGIVFEYEQWLLLPIAFVSFALVAALSHHLFHRWSQHYRSLPWTERGQWNAHVVSQVHAVCALAGGAACMAEAWPHVLTADVEYFALSSTAVRQAALCITCGYLLFDCANLVMFFDVDVLTVAHHLGILVAFILGSVSGIGTLYMALFLLNEFSTLFLNANFFMAHFDAWRSGNWYIANGVCLAAAFLMFRVLFNSLCCAHMAYVLLV